MNLLLIEDDEIDVLAVQRALASMDFDGQLYVARSADEAEDLLRDPSRKVDLILLDLNLPGRSGHEFLQDMHGDGKGRQPPIVMLTSSTHSRDLERCFAAAAAGYFVKSLDCAELSETLSTILGYWQRSSLPVEAMA